MQEITQKIKDNALKDFTPLIEQMAAEGMSSEKIAGAFKAHIDGKIKAFYRRPDFSRVAGLVDKVILRGPDSKAEWILARMLYDSGIKFVFHKQIGPYEADYIVNDTVIVEIDGPLHDQKRDQRRDAYLRRMGYRVIRLPIWIISLTPDAAIAEIKEASCVKKRGRASPR